MAWLLIDNSNTRTKFALGDADSLDEWRAVLPTADVSRESLADVLKGVDFSAVIICSVVPNKATVLGKFFEARCPVHFLGQESPLGLGIDYPLPGQIGADRLANAAGVLTRHGAPAIVIDFGTAVTFDVVSEAPAYCGGVIAPGLGAMSAYLPGKTALLPLIELVEPASAIGKSTEHAMQAGAVFGYRGLVREIIARIRAELGGTPKIIATGGDAALIARGVSEIDAVDADITLDGLRQVAARLSAADDLLLPECDSRAGSTPPQDDSRMIHG
jgi:type III pantothenate kinase